MPRARLNRTALPLVLTALLVLLAPAALATTVSNSVGPGGPVFYPNADGEQLDAHSPHILKVESGGNGYDAGYYLYGDSLDCGWYYAGNGAPSTRTYCGVNIYYSQDLKHWSKIGPAFNVTSTSTVFRGQSLATICAGGCFRPKVVYNAGTGTFVMWLNVADTGVTNSTYVVLTSDSPAGAFKPASDPQLTGASNGDEDVYVDPAGTAWIVYTRIDGNNHYFEIDRLDSTYTKRDDANPITVSLRSLADSSNFPGAGVEAPTLFSQKVLTSSNGQAGYRTRYYLMFGPTCPYCNATPTDIATSWSPSGPWSTPQQINANSCYGQPDDVLPLRDPDSVNQLGFLYLSDQWKGGNPNDHNALGSLSQALSSVYVGRMYADSADGTISSMSCTGATAVPTTESPDPALPSGWQGTATSQGLAASCVIGSGASTVPMAPPGSLSNLVQTFTPTRAGTLDSVWISAFQRYNAGNTSSVPDLPLVVSIAKMSGSTVGPALATRLFQPSDVAWAPSWLKLANLQITVSAKDISGGTRYAIFLWTASTHGCYGVALSNPSNAAGVLDAYPSGTVLGGVNGAPAAYPLIHADLDFRTNL